MRESSGVVKRSPLSGQPASRLRKREAIGREMEGRVGFEPTTPGLKVRDSSAELATQGREGSPAVYV